MRGAALTVAALALAAAPGAAGASSAGAAPRVEQMVVFRSGEALSRSVSSAGVRVQVGRRRCAAGDGTALAVLVRSRPGRLRLRDFGACSRRPRDGAGLFVQAIRSDRNRGQNGWVYKVGRKAATAGAADPAGPFGRGRLRSGQRITWFYCRLREGGCQRTLEVRATVDAGAVVASVRGYDDEGRGVPVDGAEVSAGALTGLTAADGTVRLELPAGSYRLVARREGMVRSFAERVVVP
ncbi:MAG TPA: hypothetical protein VK307_10175 [Thermoleophilaceae bacterium]|nr:hypothetical protein [Thermoleophilaceae bacterium]